MNFKVSKLIAYICACGLVVSSLTACEKQKNGPTNDALLYSEPTPTPAPWENPEYPKEIREEIYGDTEIFSTPRIQFTATVWDSEREDIWSMRMDGSDRRRVVAWQNLFNGDRLINVPERSPNNRYIAVKMDGEKGYIGFYDLKEKTSTHIIDGRGVPMFNWTPDSENLIFHTDSRIYKYNLPNSKLEEYPITGEYAKEIFIFPDGKRFLIFKGSGYWIVDEAGKVLKKVDFGFPVDWSVQAHKVTPNGKFLYFFTTGRTDGKSTTSHFIDIETGKTVAEFESKTAMGTYRFHFSPDSKSLFQIKYKNFIHYELFSWNKTQTPVKELWIWKMPSPTSVTVFNLKQLQGRQSE
ncbi:MAG: WD40 repeat domain-containing protein [Agarilytica sp.]